MATGYTHNTYEGKDETIAEFMTHLCRGLGAYVMQRDEPDAAPLREREVSEYYRTSVKDRQAELDRVLAMTQEQKVSAMAKENADAMAYYDERLLHQEKVSERYAARADEFYGLDWSLVDTPGPVGEFFSGLYRFGDQQLTDSIEFDCSAPSKPELHHDVDKWYADKVKHAADALAYAAKSLNEEIARVADQNLIHKAVTRWIENMSKTS